MMVGHLSNAQLKNYGKKADALWQAGLWYEAAEAYKTAASKLSKKTKNTLKNAGLFTYRSAECYRRIHKFKAAEIQYEKAILLKHFRSNPKVYFQLGEMQMAQGNYEKALENFKAHEQFNTNYPLTEIRLKSCEKYLATNGYNNR